MKSKAAVQTGPEEPLTLAEIEIPDPKDDQVLV